MSRGEGGRGGNSEDAGEENGVPVSRQVPTPPTKIRRPHAGFGGGEKKAGGGGVSDGFFATAAFRSAGSFSTRRCFLSSRLCFASTSRGSMALVVLFLGFLNV